MTPEKKKWVEEVKRVQAESIQPDSVRVRLISIIEKQERMLDLCKKVMGIELDSMTYRVVMFGLEEMER